MSSKEWKSTLRAMVRDPGKRVMKQAQANIAKISPGKALSHKTYKGRAVAAGFASRSIRMRVKIFPQRGISVAVIGVLSEAFYALSFFELGVPSRGIQREPWLSPALAQQQTSIVTDIGAALKKRLLSIARARSRAALKAGAA